MFTMLVSPVLLILLVQFEIRGCAAVNDSNTIVEDLSQFPRGPETCPDLIAWPQVPVPISCDDPGCRGISWAVPPYRCRQQGGTMYGIEVFGCPCCPRLIDCEDPRCAGSPSEEICQSELLKNCVCVSSNRRVPAAAAPQVEEDAVSVPSIQESFSNEMEALAMTSDSRTCPRNPPVRCLDHQCRGSDDWKTESDMSSTPRCNRADGKLVIDGIETALHGCPCCPEYIACSSTDYNGDANQACTSVPLRGCFCNWPGRIMFPYWQASWQPDNEPAVLLNSFDAAFDDPDFHPDHSQILSTTSMVSFSTSLSTFSETRARASTTPRNTASPIPQNSTWIDLLLSREEAFGRSQNSSGFVMLDHIKHT